MRKTKYPPVIRLDNGEMYISKEAVFLIIDSFHSGLEARVGELTEEIIGDGDCDIRAVKQSIKAQMDDYNSYYSDLRKQLKDLFKAFKKEIRNKKSKYIKKQIISFFREYKEDNKEKDNA